MDENSEEGKRKKTEHGERGAGVVRETEEETQEGRGTEEKGGRRGEGVEGREE